MSTGQTEATQKKKKSIVLLTIMLVLIGVLATTAGKAFADESSDPNALMDQVRNVRSQIDESQTKYLSAVQESAQYQAQLDEAQNELTNIQNELADKQAFLGTICKTEYRDPIAKTMLDALLSSTSFGDVIQKIEYANKLMQQRADAAASIAKLESDQLDKMSDIQTKKDASDQAAKEATESENSWKAKLNDMRPQLEQIRSAYLATMNGKAGNSQLESAINYLQDVDGMTDIQQRILRAAYSTPYCGSNYCEKWVMNVYRNAGIQMGMYATAWDDYCALNVSNDVDAAPVGALAYSSGTGIYAGHVGIVVAAGTGNKDALILDNEGSRTMKAVTVKEWESWMRPSPNNGKNGMFGWGYPRSITIAPVDL